MLNNVSSIDLSFCNQITDISVLTSVKNLVIKNHTGLVSGIIKLRNLYSIDVSFSHNILDIEKINKNFI
jgi:hypothetical protein